MKRLIILFISTSVFLLSCIDTQKVKDNVRLNLTSDSTKYWDIVSKPNLFSKSKSRVFPFYWYSFSANGQYKFYSKKKNKRLYSDNGDLVLPEHWSLIKEKNLILNGDTVEIVLLSPDTLKYLNNRNELTVLARSQNQSTEMDSIGETIPMLVPIDGIRP